MQASTMSQTSYRTEGGLTVRRETLAADAATLMPDLAKRLDRQRGVLLSSSFEFPGRYTRLDMGFADPPVMLTARGREVTVTALNARGETLLRAIAPALRGMAEAGEAEASATRLFLRLREPEGRFPEEQRSRQPSVFSVLRRLGELFRAREAEHRGLYGALGKVLRERFQGRRVGLVTSDGGLARATGLALAAGPPVAHGGLKVRLYQTGPLPG